MPDITPVTPVRWTPSHTVLVIAAAIATGVIAALGALKNDPTYGPWVQPILLVLVPLLTALGIYSGKGLGGPTGGGPTGGGLTTLMMFAGLGLATIVAGSFGCGTLKQDVTQAIDITNATCKVLDAQPEPAWVYFACSVIDAGGQLVQQYTVKIPKPNAAEFAMAHAPPPGN